MFDTLSQVKDRLAELRKIYDHESSNLYQLDREIEEMEKELQWKTMCHSNLVSRTEDLGKEILLFEEIEEKFND